jgi:hypothetical protein
MSLCNKPAICCKSTEVAPVAHVMSLCNKPAICCKSTQVAPVGGGMSTVQYSSSWVAMKKDIGALITLFNDLALYHILSVGSVLPFMQHISSSIITLLKDRFGRLITLHVSFFNASNIHFTKQLYV